MKEVVVLLALATAGTCIKYDGLKVKFGISDAQADKEYFFTIPRTVSEAAGSGWNKTERPEGPMKELQMYCPRGRIVCPLYYNDTTGFVAGLQIAAPVGSIDPALNPEKYFVKWNASAVDGEPAQEFWTATQYYVSEDSLKTSANRAKENNSTLQDTGVWVQGLDGKLMKIQLLEAEINRTDFKKQNCVRNMGTHYYLNMSRQLECKKHMLPWFPLVKKGELLGVGFQTFGKKPTIDAETRKTQKDFYEDLPPQREAPLHAIPYAPECFLDLSQKYGRLSIHIYYISKPWELTCEPSDSIAPVPPRPNSASFSRPSALGEILFSAFFLTWRFMS